MTTFDATVPAAQIGAVAPAASVVRFGGEPRAFWRLLAHGAVLLMFTLGIYRFWLTTDIRRFLWSNTELAGESFEYTGTARELLLGFLIAIAILLPLYAGFFLVTLSLGELSSLLALLVLTVLGHYAVYRARRYRLTRTVYRGVRFHQSGSAWRYAICAVFWWTLILSTLGLVYPFAQSQLERFKMRNTFFGDLQGRFEGSGFRLFLRGFALWLLAVVPFCIGLVATVRVVDWSTLTDAPGGDDLSSWLEASGLAGAVVYAALTGIWVLLAFVLLYPIFQAIVLRWWTSGLRFGEVVVDITPAHGAGARRLCSLPVVCVTVQPGGGRSRCPRGHRASEAHRGTRFDAQGNRHDARGSCRLCCDRARLLHNLSGHRQARALAVRGGIPRHLQSRRAREGDGSRAAGLPGRRRSRRRVKRGRDLNA